MWYTLGILCHIVCVYGTCSECCLPGGVCDTAYKNGPGICCGGGACCPMGAMCVRCEHGVRRCAYPPYTGCSRTRYHEMEEGTLFLLLVVVGMCMVGACRWLRLHHYHSPSSLPPVTNVVASSPPTDGLATGLIGGLLLSDVLHDHSPEPEPPSYMESTFEADV